MSAPGFVMRWSTSTHWWAAWLSRIEITPVWWFYLLHIPKLKKTWQSCGVFCQTQFDTSHFYHNCSQVLKSVLHNKLSFCCAAFSTSNPLRCDSKLTTMQKWSLGSWNISTSLITLLWREILLLWYEICPLSKEKENMAGFFLSSYGAIDNLFKQK